MYVNGKMRPVKTIPGMRGGRTMENDGGVNLTQIYGKKICKVTMYPQYNNNKNIFKRFCSPEKHVKILNSDAPNNMAMKS
jgi:hypothetical protein